MDIIPIRKGNNGMNTIKYELKKNIKEISHSDRMEIMQGCTLNQEDQESEIIKSFDNKDDALLELRNYNTEITELSGEAGKYYSISEYYIEENSYNEDCEWEEGGDIHAFSEIQIEVVEKPEHKTVEIYNSFSDAEEKLEGLAEGFLQFK